jgi:ABC-type bacteriocin/lantibiotic exporter with double-glycine peptidase domain
LNLKIFIRGKQVLMVPLMTLSFLSLSCATNPGLKTLSDEAVLLDIPVARQTSPNLCGEVALEMLTRYYNVLLTLEQETRLKQEAEKEKGITGLTMKKVLEEQGYFTAVFSGTLDREISGLYRHLDSRRPLVVMIQGDGADKNHYVLAVGYDENTNNVVLLDPVRGEIAMSVINFKKVWGKVQNFTLLAMPKKLKNKVIRDP